MKKLLLMTIVLSNLSLIAQEGLNRTWFLTDLTVGGEDIFIPNEENQDGYPTLSILINDTEGQIEGNGICNSFLSSEVIDAVAATETMITFDISPTLVVCETSEEIAFEVAYFIFLGAPDPEEFTYDVAGNSLDGLSLTLTKSNGDIAIYSAINENPPTALTQESWYLDYFETNGVEQNYPQSQPLQYRNLIESSFNSSVFEHDFLCIDGGSTSYNTYTYFNEAFIEFGATNTFAMDCSEPIAIEYDISYYQQIQLKRHSFEIIVEGQGIRMILTDQNGDRTFYTNAFLNTDSFDTAADISISPNPAQDFIKISGGSIDKIHSYSIIDLNGKILLQDHFQSTLDVHNLPKGLYFLFLSQDQSSIVKRFVKR